MKNLILIIAFSITGAMSAQTWLTDINKAKKIAQTEHKPIFLVFEGSDWCAPCKKLERYILSSEDFKAYAKDHLVLLKADFPRRKKNRLLEAQQKHNDALAAQYNPEGVFPTVIILDAQGNVLGRTGYLRHKSPQFYINWIKEKTHQQ